MKILFVSPEVSPLVRTGGLGDVVGSLPVALGNQGLDVRIICPLHRSCRDLPRDLYPKPISFPLGNKTYSFAVSSTRLSDSQVTVYFIRNDSLFDRDGIYSSENGDFSDNALRAFALSKAAIELEKSTGWQPDIFHAHDWMAAPTSAFLNHKKSKLKRKVASVLTIHNLEHQGVFRYDDFLDSNLPKSYWGMEGFEHNNFLNLLKGGIQHADKLTTVSPSYADEIKTPTFGQGLEKSLIYRAADLIGILNGIDEKAWNPETDTSIPQNFKIDTATEGKKICKQALQAELGLQNNKDVPLYGVVSRLYHQKGLDLLTDSIPKLLNQNDYQFVILGSGDSQEEEDFKNLSEKYPTQVASYIGFDDGLARRIFAGSDFFLMPSRFEPCGLSQQYALRYGSIPIARNTGGLSDTITSFKNNGKRANGFLFNLPDAKELAGVIHRSRVIYQDHTTFLKIRENAMKSSFSWASAAQQYKKTYEWALEK